MHPFDVYHAVPDHLLRVLFDVITLGPATIMQRRNTLLSMWRKWASEMNLQESQLKASMEAGVREVLVLLLKRIASDIGWVDTKFCDELCEGFRLTGLQDLSGVFPLEARFAMRFLRLALLGKVRSSSVNEDASILWELT